MGIAIALMGEIERAAASNGVTRVSRVRVDCGQLRAIEPAAIQLAFRAVTAGTLTDGAELVLNEIPARARCRSCGHEFAPEVFVFLCPECGQANAELLAGEELLLRDMECDVAGAEAANTRP